MASKDFLIFSTERRKTITLRKDEWAAITSGECMIFCVTSTSQTGVFSHASYVTDNSEAIYTSVQMRHVAAGCHQDHRQSHIIIRSLHCCLRGCYALFWYHCCSVLGCVLLFLRVAPRLSIKQGKSDMRGSSCNWQEALRASPTQNLHNANSANHQQVSPSVGAVV